ncbi:MAG: hypothetical protein OXF95_01370 [Rhodobacteraceae bacterium]|nr:hypothetical protein [Paracoccaceae bacterium]
MFEYTNLESTYPKLHWVEQYSENNATDKNSWEFIRKDTKDTDNILLSNWDAHVYSEILHTIDQMTRLPEDDQLHLDSKIATKAINLLGFLKEQLKIHPPKIINQDGEALSYTWVVGNCKRYLTVSDDEVDLMVLAQDGQDSHEEVLSRGENLPFDKIIKRLLVQTKSHST